jgi:pyruvate dehydrogenase E2 component (dihydrolipoamide acetyltransferase)
MLFEVEAEAGATASAPAKAEAAKPAASETPAAKAAPESNADKPSGFVENSAYVHASPVIRRLAREFGVDLAKVKGSGRKGRIVKEDVQAYVKQAVKALESGASAGGSGMAVAPWPSIDYSKFGEVEEVPLSRIQKISGPALHRNWVKIPHVTQFDEADISEMEAFRKEQNVIAEKQQLGFKITPLVFMLKAAAKTLESMPKFNSALSDDGNSLIMKKYIHIGVAVDTPNGLVVPVVRDVNKKGIYQLSEELVEISKKARAGKLTASDMQGGCFTISSLGGIGGTQFTPIVNAPEVAILGVSRSEMKPKWNGKEFEPKLMLPLALSYDHRVIDGADGARFISILSGLLGDIRRLVL